MRNLTVARLTEGMSLADIQQELRKLGPLNSPPLQHHTMENGVEVIYVKQSLPQDKLRRKFMSSEMRTDEARPLANLILQACEKIKIQITDSRYQGIRESFISNKGEFESNMTDLVATEIMKKI